MHLQFDETILRSVFFFGLPSWLPPSTSCHGRDRCTVWAPHFRLRQPGSDWRRLRRPSSLPRTCQIHLTPCGLAAAPRGVAARRARLVAAGVLRHPGGRSEGGPRRAAASSRAARPAGSSVRSGCSGSPPTGPCTTSPRTTSTRPTWCSTCCSRSSWRPCSCWACPPGWRGWSSATGASYGGLKRLARPLVAGILYNVVFAFAHWPAIVNDSVGSGASTSAPTSCWSPAPC